MDHTSPAQLRFSHIPSMKILGYLSLWGNCMPPFMTDQLLHKRYEPYLELVLELKLLKLSIWLSQAPDVHSDISYGRECHTPGRFRHAIRESRAAQQKEFRLSVKAGARYRHHSAAGQKFDARIYQGTQSGLRNFGHGRSSQFTPNSWSGCFAIYLRINSSDNESGESSGGYNNSGRRNGRCGVCRKIRSLRKECNHCRNASIYCHGCGATHPASAFGEAGQSRRYLPGFHQNPVGHGKQH